ncbi:amidase-like protein [Trichoderma cornu-damae]|uniref:Amidase-like protein n=1 Tax=Trichoderma cornu-damae TaxID=654480 RepID=A0A9P8QJ14_9HYPO|nr:amidase-like protein [Trichoderma cornu-damae]
MPFLRYLTPLSLICGAGWTANLFTSVDLVQAHIDRILEVNAVLRAVTEINPDALSVASQRDAERRAGIDPAKQPLHGIPIRLRNNIATNDGMNNARWLICPVGRFSRASPPRGLVGSLAAKQLAPTTQGKAPRGSSSGSAVSVSIGLAWAAVGTDTGGSIPLPGHANHVAGFRPTVGLTSRYLVIPCSEM